MRHPITGIDHTLVGVRDLEAARATWQALGFTLAPRGRHIGWGTANYCIMLEQGYIELLGIVDAAQFTNNLDRFLAEREGLMGIAFASDNAAATATALRDAGLHPDGPKDLKRLLELPGGDVLAAFSLLFLPPQETPGLNAFICQHLTPKLIRAPEWLGHANGAKRVAEVTVLVGDPHQTAIGYAPLFGRQAIKGSGSGATVDTGGGLLRFLTQEGLRQRYLDMLPPSIPSPPWTAAMTLATTNAEFAGRKISANGTIVELTPH